MCDPYFPKWNCHFGLVTGNHHFHPFWTRPLLGLRSTSVHLALGCLRGPWVFRRQVGRVVEKQAARAQFQEARTERKAGPLGSPGPWQFCEMLVIGCHRSGVILWLPPIFVLMNNYNEWVKDSYIQTMTIHDTPKKWVHNGAPSLIHIKIIQYSSVGPGNYVIGWRTLTLFQLLIYNGVVFKLPKNIKKHQKTSKNIKKHQKTSKNIKKHQKTSKKHQKTSKNIKKHQTTSSTCVVIECHRVLNIICHVFPIIFHVFPQRFHHDVPQKIVQAAGLLEKAAGDLMRLKLGQVPPGETVLVRLDLTMELQNQSGSLAKIVQLAGQLGSSGSPWCWKP